MSKAEIFPFYAEQTTTVPCCTLSLSGLVGLVQSPSMGAKDRAPLFTPYKAHGKTLAKAKDASFYALIQDHDDDNLTKEQVRAIYDPLGCAYLAFTSSSHMQDKHGVIARRWKVVIPFDEPVTAEMFTELAQGAAMELNTDPAQVRLNQICYAPNKLTSDAPYDFVDATHRPLMNPQEHAFTKRARKAYHRDQARRQKAAKAAKPKRRDAVQVSGAGSVIDKVCERYDLHSELVRYGYKKVGNAYLSPTSGSGSPGVHILKGQDGKERCYSHHGPSDPLSHDSHDGHALDVFDVICACEYAGDVGRAVAALADKVDPEGQKERQREYMAEQERQANATNSEAKPAFALVPVGELVNNTKPPQWLIKGLVEADTLAQLFGQSGAGKSFISIDWACCVATGEPWQGKTVQQGSVIYLAGEGHGGLARRFRAWGQHRGICLVDAPLFVSKTAAALMDEESAKAVTAAVNQVAESYGQPALIVVDTLARNLGPGDENSNADVGKFIKALDQMRERFGATVLIVHHTGHMEQARARGASSLRAAVDHEYQAESRAGGVVKITAHKMKEGELPEPIWLAMHQVQVGDDKEGKPVHSAVLISDLEPAKPEKGLTGSQRAALETFERAAGEHGDLTADGEFVGLHLEKWRGAYYANSTADNQEAKKKAFQRVRNDLVKIGELSVNDDVYQFTGSLCTYTIERIKEAIQSRLAGSEPWKRESGTPGHERDMPGQLSRENPLYRDIPGHTPKGVSRVPLDFDENSSRTGILEKSPKDQEEAA